jgi:Dyp-type peroxidase family
MAASPVKAGDVEELETGDMQGLIARAYGHLPFARYLLCRFGEPAAARSWLGSVAKDLFTADRPSDERPCINLALSWDGLRHLGLPADSLATFPRPMQEGMVTPHRSRILGDVGNSDPAAWRWGCGDAAKDAGVFHVLVMLFAKTLEALDGEHEARSAAWSGVVEVVGEPIEGRLLPDAGHEHFGFADGLSQPRVKGWPSGRRSSVRPAAPAASDRFSEVEPGEIILGYLDNFGKPAEGPTVPDGPGARMLPPAPWADRRRDLGRNGSFLVVRQLSQDVPAFHRALEAASAASAARGEALSAAQIGAKVVGRWPSGAPTVTWPDSDPGSPGDNDFGYAADDAAGLRCPLGAHVRRANPRDASEDSPGATLASTRNHRILRHGRPYGPPISSGEDAERGLMFICLNADIERQFEFVQHTWLNNPFFAGLRGEVDPVVGDDPQTKGVFTIPTDPVRRRVGGLGSFVTTRGGAYLFLPGVKALQHLSQMTV